MSDLDLTKCPVCLEGVGITADFRIIEHDRVVADAPIGALDRVRTKFVPCLGSGREVAMEYDAGDDGDRDFKDDVA